MRYIKPQESLNKCPKCGSPMHDLGYHKDSRGTFCIFECTSCFFQLTPRMELYGRKW